MERPLSKWTALSGTVYKDGGSSKEVPMRLQAGAAARRRVEGIVWDIKLKKQLKGKVLESYVIPACVYGFGTFSVTERQEKFQIAENN